MTPRRDAVLLSRILRFGLLFALVAQVLWSFRPTASSAQTDRLSQGQQLYEASCST